MASLPARQDKSSPKLNNFEEQVTALFYRGWSPSQVARHIYPDDPRLRKNLRKKLWRMIESDPRIHNRIAQRAQAELAMGLGPATKRLTKRAARLGKPAEVKLVYEASGFHNPRVQHEHSGDIKISLDMPRPARVVDEDDVIDAEVVDD